MSEKVCKGPNCNASASNGYKHSSECLFEYRRNLASGVESVELGVKLDDAVTHIVWRGREINLSAPPLPTNVKDALERLSFYADYQWHEGDHEPYMDAAIIRAHIEKLNAGLRKANAQSEDFERRYYLADQAREAAEARVRELEAVAEYADHRVNCRHATFVSEACDCGLDAAIDATRRK